MPKQKKRVYPSRRMKVVSSAPKEQKISFTLKAKEIAKELQENEDYQKMVQNPLYKDLVSNIEAFSDEFQYKMALALKEEVRKIEKAKKAFEDSMTRLSDIERAVDLAERRQKSQEEYAQTLKDQSKKAREETREAKRELKELSDYHNHPRVYKMVFRDPEWWIYVEGGKIYKNKDFLVALDKAHKEVE